MAEGCIAFWRIGRRPLGASLTAPAGVPFLAVIGRFVDWRARQAWAAPRPHAGRSSAWSRPPRPPSAPRGRAGASANDLRKQLICAALKRVLGCAVRPAWTECDNSRFEGRRESGGRYPRDGP